MSKKKYLPIPVDVTTHEEMRQYAATYGLSLTDLIARMWSLWRDMDKTREGLMPMFPPLQEPLEPFLAEMETQAIDLDEEYLATQAREEKE